MIGFIYISSEFVNEIPTDMSISFKRRGIGDAFVYKFVESWQKYTVHQVIDV